MKLTEILLICRYCGRRITADKALLSPSNRVYCSEEHFTAFNDSVRLCEELVSRIVTLTRKLRGDSSYLPPVGPLSNWDYARLNEEFRKNTLHLEQRFVDELSMRVAEVSIDGGSFGQDITAELRELTDAVSIERFFPTRPRGPASFFTLHLIHSKTRKELDVYRVLISTDKDQPVRVFDSSKIY